MNQRRPWTQSDTATLEQMAGRPDREIALAIGCELWKVREMRQAQGIKAHAGNRSHWSRRDWLLNDAAGCDMVVA